MKKEMNNKGFSLVELIIVIAIMAVLVGLLAPQYLKYVNNSKVSTDISNAQDIATAVNVAFADDVLPAGTTTVSGIPQMNAGTLQYLPFPDSKLTPGTATWVVNLDDNGVSTITLNGADIWPDPKKASTGYYTQFHK